MRKRKRRTVRTVYLNKLYRMNAVIYVVVIIFLGGLLSYYTSELEKSSIISLNHEALNEITHYYEMKNNNFWSVYKPIYKERNYGYGKERPYLQAVIDFYQDEEGDWQKNTLLLDMLEDAIAQDSDIKWIAMYRNAYPETAYLFTTGTKTLRAVAEKDFSFLTDIKTKTGERIRKNMGTKPVKYLMDASSNTEILTYAISGNMNSMTGGVSLGVYAVGYDTNTLHNIYRQYNFSLVPHIMIANYSGDVIYDSRGKAYGTKVEVERYAGKQGSIWDAEGNRLYIDTYSYPTKNYFVMSTVSWDELNRMSRKSSPLIWGLTVFLAALAAFLYLLTGHLSARKVHVILDSLNEISREQNLSYRIPVASERDEFGVIASNINHMTEQLQDYVEKVYVYSIKQKNAELGELQAKFNPHFLYNTLEVIRAELQEKGDAETSDMVLLLSRIFRSFINKRHFVTIQEELSACDVYLELFRLRYKGKIEAGFDVDTEVLNYGIIRNLLQPAIENYFVHGFTAGREKNEIYITGHEDREYPGCILLTVKNNGAPIPADRLEEINRELERPSSTHEDGRGGYGLKNLHDRIRTFYGEPCGIQVFSDGVEGTETRFRIGKLTDMEHEEKMKKMKELE